MAKYRIELATIDLEKDEVEIPATARIVGFVPWNNGQIAYLVEVDK